jgi:cytochrome c554/c'-like protein
VILQNVWVALFSGLALSALGPQLPPAVRANQCATCHLRIVWTRSALTHTDEWVTSSHALHGVGCERCHGGNAATSDKAFAHRGIANSADPLSRVHRRVLPTTCGGCHPSQRHAFVSSRHYELLLDGVAGAPTCTSCHSSMAADIPSAIEVERRCAACHDTERDQRARDARRDVEEIALLRRKLARTKLQMAGVADGARRRELGAEWNDVDAAVRETIAAMHGFDDRRIQDRLAQARARSDRLEATLGK